ncbi:Uncharacterised protein [Stenotrophomonas maltophilia]|nr:Uncharacterised protein [Stenotrophomonas maltophilia]
MLHLGGGGAGHHFLGRQLPVNDNDLLVGAVAADASGVRLRLRLCLSFSLLAALGERGSGLLVSLLPLPHDLGLQLRHLCDFALAHVIELPGQPLLRCFGEFVLRLGGRLKLCLVLSQLLTLLSDPVQRVGKLDKRVGPAELAHRLQCRFGDLANAERHSLRSGPGLPHLLAHSFRATPNPVNLVRRTSRALAHLVQPLPAAAGSVLQLAHCHVTHITQPLHAALSVVDRFLHCELAIDVVPAPLVAVRRCSTGCVGIRPESATNVFDRGLTASRAVTDRFEGALGGVPRRIERRLGLDAKPGEFVGQRIDGNLNFADASVERCRRPRGRIEADLTLPPCRFQQCAQRTRFVQRRDLAKRCLECGLDLDTGSDRALGHSTKRRDRVFATSTEADAHARCGNTKPLHCSNKRGLQHGCGIGGALRHSLKRRLGRSLEAEQLVTGQLLQRLQQPITHIALCGGALGGDVAQRRPDRLQARRVCEIEPLEHLADRFLRELCVPVDPSQLLHHQLGSRADSIHERVRSSLDAPPERRKARRHLQQLLCDLTQLLQLLSRRDAGLLLHQQETFLRCEVLFQAGQPLFVGLPLGLAQLGNFLSRLDNHVAVSNERHCLFTQLQRRIAYLADVGPLRFTGTLQRRVVLLPDVLRHGLEDIQTAHRRFQSQHGHRDGDCLRQTAQQRTKPTDTPAAACDRCIVGDLRVRGRDQGCAPCVQLEQGPHDLELRICGGHQADHAGMVHNPLRRALHRLGHGDDGLGGLLGPAR